MRVVRGALWMISTWRMPVGKRVHRVAVIGERSLGCTLRNDPYVPVQHILRTLLRMKMSGEIDQIIELYTGEKNRALEHS